MYVVGLKSSNVKALHVVELENLDGTLVEITGDNEQGKSTLMTSIFWALAGKSVIQKDPIHHGEESALIEVQLGTSEEPAKFIIRRTFERDDDSYTTKVTIEAADGQAYGQKKLNDLMQSLQFDLGEFMRMKPEDHFNVLRRFCPGVDFEAMDRMHKGDTERRRTINAKAEDTKATANAIMIPPEPTLVAATRLDPAEVQGKLASSTERQQARDAALLTIRLADEAIANVKTSILHKIVDIANTKEEIEQLQRQLAAQEADLGDLTDSQIALERKRAALPAVPEPIDTAALVTELERINAHNAAIAESLRQYDRAVELRNESVERKAVLMREHARLVAQADDITATMKKRQEGKEAAIAAAKMPVQGLGFGDGFITYNGSRFDQCSKAETIRVAAAIAMSADTPLKVLLITDASLLDRKSWKIVLDMAKERGYQVWAETIEARTEGAIVIEDGRRVKERRQEVAA